MTRFLAMAGLAFLSACGYPRGSGSTSLNDGSYQGQGQLVAGDPKLCPAGRRRGVIEIADNTLDFGYSPDVSLEAVVQPDGTLHVERGTVVLDGKVVDHQVLTFTITTPDCTSSYSTNFIWNHS